MQVKKIAEEEGDGSPFKLLEKDITKCKPSLSNDYGSHDFMFNVSIDTTIPALPCKEF